jgi:hypothetical protein
MGAEKVKRWRTTGELMTDVQDALVRLRDGTSSVDQAHAEARLLATAQRVVLVELEHARLSGRIEQGSDLLPGVRLGSGEEGDDGSDGR